MNRLLLFLPIAFFAFGFQASHAQNQGPTFRQCASTLLHLRSPNRSLYSGGKVFESWMKRMEEKESAKSVQDNDEIYYIPVVIHILHNGEPLGTARNVDDSRVASQIQILNNDYGKRFFTPGYNTHPSGADTKIRFCLAAIGPNGEATTGIVRVNTTQPDFDLSQDNTTIKNYSVWNPDKYLNVWVCKLQNNFLGYAQYPYTDSIPFNGVVDVQPDGVVIDYRAFGNVPPGGEYPSYNMGRTTTHEIGHYLGLLHIWGDGTGCSDSNGTDFCGDTPKQANYTSGCPTTVQISCDSSNANMIQNYLDYTNDVCMNIFTFDQKKRMRIVMRNAPRRKTLFTTPTQCGLFAQNYSLVEKNWTLYPNPATDQIEIESSEDSPLGQIEVRNLNGKLCISIPSGNEFRKMISLNSLADGWYIASVAAPNGKISFRKFVRN